MSAVEISALVVAIVLVITNAAALAMWRRARRERDMAVKTVETVAQSAERAIGSIGDELAAVTAERDAAGARAALAESSAIIAEAAWNRAVDALQKAQRPAPVTYGTEQTPVPGQARSYLQAVPRG